MKFLSPIFYFFSHLNPRYPSSRQHQRQKMCTNLGLNITIVLVSPEFFVDFKSDSNTEHVLCRSYS